MWGGGALRQKLSQPLRCCCTPPEDGVDEAEYPAPPSQGQDSASQDSVAAAEAAPLAAALMETSPPVISEGQDESGALFSEGEVSEQVVDRDGYLVERAAGPHIVKEIIIYDVYDNDENVGAGNPVDPTTAIELEHPKTIVVDESHDSDNCLEDLNVAEHVAALNQNVENVEIVNNVADAAKGDANENEENIESNSSANNVESSVDPPNNGAPPIEEITKVVDEVVDNDPELNENVAEVAVEGMEMEVSAVLSPPSNPIQDIQSGYGGRSWSKNLKNVATAVRVFRHASQPSLPSQLRGAH